MVPEDFAAAAIGDRRANGVHRGPWLQSRRVKPGRAAQSQGRRASLYARGMGNG
jgi:hypothetical protein